MAPRDGSAEPRGRGEFPLVFSQAGTMRGRVDRDADVVRLTLTGEFDLAASEPFTSALAGIEATGPRAIVVDLRELSYMDSTGPRDLLAAHRRAADAHLFAVLNGSGPAHRTLALAGLDEQLLMVDQPSQLPL